MKDAVATMGNVLPDDVGGRDAVHVAVFSAVCPTKSVYPGDPVLIVSHGERDTEVEPCPAGRHDKGAVAIVDPFLEFRVAEGQRFWAYLMPRTITALSHRWSHPAFEDVATSYVPPSTKLASEQWLRAFIDRSDCPSYEIMMGAAARIADGESGSDWDDEYLHFDGRDAHGEIPPEFWNHAEVVLGRPIRGPKAKWFSCSC